MRRNYTSYPGYEQKTLRGLDGKNVALLEDLKRGILLYVYRTKYGYEEDAYYFYGANEGRTGSWFPLKDHPDYAQYYEDCQERQIVMAADIQDFHFYGPQSFQKEPLEYDTAV